MKSNGYKLATMTAATEEKWVTFMFESQGIKPRDFPKLPPMPKNSGPDLKAALKAGAPRRDMILRMAYNEPITSNRLADNSDIQPKRCSHHLNSLKNRGYFTVTGKIKAEKGNSMNVYSITEQGRKLVEALG